MRFYVGFVTLAALLIGGLSLTAAPASAAATITLTTTKGQVRVTAAGLGADDFYYHFVIRDSRAELVRSESVLAQDDGTLIVDLPTWGIGDASVHLLRCANRDCTLGGTALLATAPLTPVDPGPTVTWDSATIVGPDSPGYSVATDETDGGGVLKAYATYHSDVREAVRGQGTTLLTFPESRNETGRVTLLRCQSETSEVCTPVAESPEIAIRRSLRAHVYGDQHFPDEAGPGGMTIIMFTDDPGDYTLDWWLEPEGTDTPLPGVGATGVPVNFPVDGRQAWVPLSFAGAGSSGPMDLRVRLSRTYPDVGTITGLSDDNLNFTLNALAANSLRVSRSAFYPHRDGYLDTVSASARTTEAVPSQLEVLNRAGTVVRRYPHASGTTHAFTWDGRTNSGRPAGAGAYTFRLRLTDWRGEHRYVTVGRTTVSWKRLVTKTFVRTLTAGASRSDAQVGRCSTLRLPSARGWSRSEGLYSGTKCRNAGAAAVVRTHHSLKVPAAVRYQRLRLSVYGGAASSRPASHLGVSVRERAGSLAGGRRLAAHLGSHTAGDYDAKRHVTSGRRVHWAVWVANQARYDVKSFTVRLTYAVLK